MCKIVKRDKKGNTTVESVSYAVKPSTSMGVNQLGVRRSNRIRLGQSYSGGSRTYMIRK